MMRFAVAGRVGRRIGPPNPIQFSPKTRREPGASREWRGLLKERAEMTSRERMRNESAMESNGGFSVF